MCIEQCTSPVSHNAPFWNRNWSMCAHFFLQNGALWDICLMHCGVCEMVLFYTHPSDWRHWHVIASMSVKYPSWIWQNILDKPLGANAINTALYSKTRPCTILWDCSTWCTQESDSSNRTEYRVNTYMISLEGDIYLLYYTHRTTETMLWDVR